MAATMRWPVRNAWRLVLAVALSASAAAQGQGTAPAVEDAEPTPPALQGETLQEAVESALSRLMLGARLGTVVEDETITLQEGDARVEERITVGVDAASGQATLALGELRLWGGRRGEGLYEVRAQHARDPLRVVVQRVRARSLPEALWSVAPPVAAPLLALAFDEPRNLWRGMEAVVWTAAAVDEATGSVRLEGDALGAKVTLQAVPVERGGRALRLVAAQSVDSAGATMQLRFHRVVSIRDEDASPWARKLLAARSWLIPVGPRVAVSTLAELAPAPSQRPPVAIAADGSPLRLGAGRDVRVVLLLRDAAEPSAVRRRAALARAASEAARKATGRKDAVVFLLATNRKGEGLLRSITTWEEALGRATAWTPAGDAALATYAPGVRADVVALFVHSGAAQTAAALRDDDLNRFPSQRLVEILAKALADRLPNRGADAADAGRDG